MTSSFGDSLPDRRSIAIEVVFDTNDFTGTLNIESVFNDALVSSRLRKPGS